MSKFKIVRNIIILVIVIVIGVSVYNFFTQESVINQTLNNNSEINYDYKTLLVNYETSLPSDFETEIVEYTDPTGTTVSISAVIEGALEKLFTAADEDGIKLKITTAYQTYEQQSLILEETISRIKKTGYTVDEVLEVSRNYEIAPGSSEFTTGLVVEFDYYGSTTEEEFNDWFEENAATYGFIMRYPEDKQDITLVDSQEDIYRYVGKSTATEINELDYCLEEYLAYLDS
ncbi:MAG: M15 family metallopeptidase [Clostridia bacterium]